MATAKVDVIDLIDRHSVSGFQIGVLILCMLVAALDGFDRQAEQIIAKARDLITPVLGASKCQSLIDQVFDLESVRNVTQLRPLLQRT